MPSANDDFASRITLTPVSGGSASFDNTGNTLQSGEPGSWARTAWYKIVPTDLRIFRFRITAIPNVAATVGFEFYTGSAVNALTRFTNDWDDHGGGESGRHAAGNRNQGFVNADLNVWQEFQLPPGADVQIQVGVLSSVHEGVISFDWEELTPPANNDWDDAVVIDTSVDVFGSESGTTENSTWDTALTGQSVWPNYIDPASFLPWTVNLRGVVWYRITSQSTSTYRLLLEPTTSAEDMRLLVTSGEFYTTQLNKGWGRPDEFTDVQFDQGIDYWIAIAALNLGTTGTNDQTRWRGTFDLSWERLDPPANDNWEDAEVISGDSGSSTNSSLLGSTFEPDEVRSFAPFDVGGSVWFEFTPTNSGTYDLSHSSAVGAFTNDILLVYTSADELTLLPRIGALNLTFDPTLEMALRAGQTYFISLAQQNAYTGYSVFADQDYGSLDWTLTDSPPANDDWANAELISGASGTVSGTNTGSTMEPGEYGYYYNTPDSELFPSNLSSVWYEWVAPATGTYQFKTDSSTAIDLELTVFTGVALETLTPISENFDGDLPIDATYDPILEFEAEVDVTYWVRVSSFAADLAGDFDLIWAADTHPANDDFAFAEVLPSTESGGPTQFDNLGADPEFEVGEPDAKTEIGPFPASAFYGRSVWFAWTPPTDATYEFTFNGDASSFHALLYEAAAVPAIETLTLLDNIELEYDTDSLQFVADSSKTYYFRIIGTMFFNSEESIDPARSYAVPQGEFEIEWVRVPVAPDNDDLTSALDDALAIGNIHVMDDRHGQETFRPSGGSYPATSRDATAEAGELSVAGFGPARTVWFYWITAFTGTARFWTESVDNTDMALAVYDHNGSFNPASPGTLLAADDDSGPGLMPQADAAVVQFNDYLIQVDTKDNPGGEFTLRWVRVTVGPPANDDFANAIELVL